jgi:hypothetical protein
MYRDAAQAEKKQIQGPASLNPWNTGANVSRLKKKTAFTFPVILSVRLSKDMLCWID